MSAIRRIPLRPVGVVAIAAAVAFASFTLLRDEGTEDAPSVTINATEKGRQILTQVAPLASQYEDLVARALSGGFHAAWPLALGVVVGDALWPLLAVLGVNWILSVFSGFMTFLRIAAAAVFLAMGALLIHIFDPFST